MTYGIRVERLPPFALFDLRGSRNAISAWTNAISSFPTMPTFPTMPNSLTRAKSGELYHTGPNRWLLRAPLDREIEWERKLDPANAPPEISIVKVSDTQTFFRLTGTDAEQVTSIGCPLDLHNDAFNSHAVSFTEFFGVKALILRCGDGFDLAVEQSFGDMIEDYLRRAIT